MQFSIFFCNPKKKKKKERKKQPQGSWAVLAPVTATLIAKRVQVTLSREGRAQTLTQLPKIKVGHLTNTATRGRRLTPSVCAGCVSDISSLRTNDPGHMFDMCMLLKPGLTLLQRVSYRWILDLFRALV